MTGTEAALCHLLLETLPPPLCLPSHISHPEVQAAASHLFDTCLVRHNARLAVKLAACFGLSTKSEGKLQSRLCHSPQDGHEKKVMLHNIGVSSASYEYWASCGLHTMSLAFLVYLVGMSAGREFGVDVQLLQDSVADMLKHKQLAQPAVSLMMHFPGLPLDFSPLEVMSVLISDGQFATAKAWASELGQETQVIPPSLQFQDMLIPSLAFF